MGNLCRSLVNNSKLNYPDYVKLNQIYHGDNLHFMRDIPNESIDMIYIDPPFGTKTLWKSSAWKEGVQDMAFYDSWGGGVNGYINFIVERLEQMYRLLKSTGSLFVHLDWRVSHYVKIELDKIFGVKNPCSKNSNFINEIIWCYKSGGASKKHFAKKHDTILFYAKDSKKYLKKFKIKKDEKSYMKPWAGKNPAQKYYVDEKGTYTLTYPKDWWTDCGMISTAAKSREYGKVDKRTGWPTQKPFSLLKKIIEATTDKNDVVADFFCGCGTAIDAAHSLQRKWMGFDASLTACNVMKDRMQERHGMLVNLTKKPMSYEDFAALGPFEFEKATVRHIGGVANDKQVADGGIDGRLAFDGTPIQVKKDSKPVGDVDKFRSFYMHARNHGRGIFITQEGYTKGAKERAAEWKREGLDIQLLTLKDVVNGNYREQPPIQRAA